MIKPNIPAKLAINCFLILFSGFAASAQKLPAVQQISLRVPKSVKTDGKLIEWGELQAYNRSTDIYYTIANSNDKLYFTMQATDPNVIKKILIGGVTFTVNLTGKKDDKESIAVTFPIIKGTQGTSIGIRLTEPGVVTDSLVRLMNEDLESKAKEIKISGLKQLADTVISVYNDVDIKTVARFDSKKTLVYELAIPLKYLSISVKEQSSFHYNVMLNGSDKSNVIMHPSASGVVMVTSVPHGLSPTGTSAMSFSFPTDFWGEYTLAK